jgi:hypothetical protein
MDICRWSLNWPHSRRTDTNGLRTSGKAESDGRKEGGFDEQSTVPAVGLACSEGCRDDDFVSDEGFTDSATTDPGRMSDTL